MAAAHVIHVEVTGKDGTALQSFYSKVFGWDIDTNNPGGAFQLYTSLGFELRSYEVVYTKPVG